ncbi:MAG: tyrosine recombinase XerC [Bacilli bacterium]|nr:tyrosine recombinase XerC [Bacilli bacterium]
MNDQIKEFLDYLEYERKYSLYTVDNYDKDITDFKDFLESKNISKFAKVEYQIIRDYLVFLYNQNYKNKTICRHISSLRSFFKFLLANKYIKTNPMTLITNPKVEKKLPNFLYYNDLEKLLETPDQTNIVGIRDELIIELFYSTGVRVSELVNIKVSDIDFSKKSIQIFGKGKKERIVLFGDRTLELIKNYLNNSEFNHEYLILNQRGKKITERGVRLILEKVVRNSGINNRVTPHTIRHTFATHMLNEGANLITVQELLGHETLATTQVYTHVSNERLRAIYLKNHPRAKKGT